MRVIWTDCARLRLREIYLFYKPLSERAARLLKARLFSRTRQLRSFPSSGTIEELLNSLGKEHRYLIEGNYKIIYRIDAEIIYVEEVFDC